MYWVGKTSDRVGRGGNIINMSETRWIVPVKPYEAPRGSWERAEKAIIMGIGIAAVLFGFSVMILGSL